MRCKPRTLPSALTKTRGKAREITIIRPKRLKNASRARSSTRNFLSRSRHLRAIFFRTIGGGTKENCVEGGFLTRP